MDKEKIEGVWKNLQFETGKWLFLNEIDSIFLKSGIGYYPNWQHIQFLMTDDFSEILIRHGKSKPYGARLNSTFNISNFGLELTFPPNCIVLPSEYYDTFRLPRKGDIIRSTAGKDKILSESLINNILPCSNGFFIEVANSITMNNISKLSFYDPILFDAEKCMHGTEIEGIYMKFEENEGKSKKNYGVCHEIIKTKEIEEINLKLSVKSKTYKIK